jgi:hypothetical protein
VYLAKVMDRKLLFVASLVLALLMAHFSSVLVHANDQNIFVLNKDGKIDAKADNRPLNQTLRELATKLSIDLKGISVGSEAVSLSLSHVSLEELLKKMMRGYNYVLVKAGKSDKLMLMVLSKADRTQYVAPPPQPASPPPAIPQPLPQPVPQAVPVASPQPQQTPRPPTDGILPPGFAAGGGARAGSGRGSGPGTAIGGPIPGGPPSGEPVPGGPVPGPGPTNQTITPSPGSPDPMPSQMPQMPQILN